jgi:hypothetical protein
MKKDKLRLEHTFESGKCFELNTTVDECDLLDTYKSVTFVQMLYPDLSLRRTKAYKNGKHVTTLNFLDNLSE